MPNPLSELTLSSLLIHRIAADLKKLGVQSGGVLMVHASLRSLGLPPGLDTRAESMVRGLLEALGPRGTLLMPALSYRTVGPDAPFFDVAQTPSCVGALSEHFRTRPGTLRSVHPTHSVCGLGEGASVLLGDHHMDTTPVGPHSAFARLPEVGAQILFLGCSLRKNTAMHAVEELVEPPYLYGEDVNYQVTLRGGGWTTMRVRSHAFDGWHQRYDRLAGLLPAGLRKGRVLAAECYLLDAAAMWQAALPALRADPLCFVERET